MGDDIELNDDDQEGTCVSYKQQQSIFDYVTQVFFFSTYLATCRETL